MLKRFTHIKKIVKYYGYDRLSTKVYVMISKRETCYQWKSLSWGFFLLTCLLMSSSAVAAVFVVDTTADSGAGSLRQAIIDSNTTPGPNFINFNIPGPGPHRIQPLTDLPAITNQVYINGYSQPGSIPNFATVGTNAILMIEINGSNYTVGDGTSTGFGLILAAGSDGSTIKGIAFNEWIFAGILISESDGNFIVGNFIGTNAGGTVQSANKNGILVFLSDNNIIGTPFPTDKNIIAGSFSDFLGGAGIAISGGSGNLVQNNLIGTDRSGLKALGNSVNGVFILPSTLVDGTVVPSESNQIGGLEPGEGNIISGQTIYGIILNSAVGTLIEGNLIGTDVTGTAALGNKNAGVALVAQFGPTILNRITENVISGNGQGIVLGSLFFNSGTTLNFIEDNLIGTDITGTQSLGNDQNGVWVLDNENFIGFLGHNVISANGENGILISSSATGNFVLGNLIGTDISGVVALGNGQNGIQLGLAGGKNSANANIIGSHLLPTQGNVISGNFQNGIRIQSFSSKNIIQANLIGVGLGGIIPVPNIGDGIQIDSSFSNLVGGNSITAGNVIAYNRTGVMVGSSAKDKESINNAILTNSIFANLTLGIDIHKNNAPDKLESHFNGPNHFQSSPKIFSAFLEDAVTLEVLGSLHSGAFTSYEIQFFGNETGRNGEGAIFLGSTIVTTNGKGKADFSATVVPILTARYVSATATRLDTDGTPLDTSEFSRSQRIIK